MSDLGTIHLGDLLSRPPEYGANASAESPNGVDPRYLRITDIDDAGHLLFDDIKCIPRFIAAHYLLSENDIVIARTGNTVGKSYLHIENNGPLAFAGYLVRFRLDEQKADPRFVFQYLHSPIYWQWIGNTLRTGAQPNVNATEYKQLPLPDFTLPQQRKIARILTTVDNLIEKTEALIAKYQAIKQGMMHDLFTRGLDKHGHLRPPYDEAPELYKQSELGWIPKEWEVKAVRDIVDDDRPVTYGIVQPGAFDPKGMLLIRGQDYISGWSSADKFFKVSQILHRQFRRSTTRCDDVLMCIVGATTGAVNRVPVWIDEANITQTTARISCDSQKCRSIFVEMFLASEGGQRQVRKYVKGSAQPGLNLADVERFILPTPPISEQELVCERLSVMRRRLEDEFTYRTALASIKTGLMQDLLTGKVRVKVDEAEEVAAHA